MDYALLIFFGVLVVALSLASLSSSLSDFGVENSIRFYFPFASLMAKRSVVPEERLELSRVAPHGSKPCAYTNFATPARLMRTKKIIAEKFCFDKSR